LGEGGESLGERMDGWIVFYDRRTAECTIREVLNGASWGAGTGTAPPSPAPPDPTGMDLALFRSPWG
jgi:hypothetical protein